MATVVFDFDSTLVDCESLDEMLVAVRPDLEEKIRAITIDGMEGRIAFRDSVESRLALARPTLAQVEAFADAAVARITPGLERLVRSLGADVWIVTGAIREVVLKVAARLAVPDERVFGTRVRWARVGPELDFFGSKADAVRDIAPGWPRPRIGVGDGMTDHALLEQGLVDHFIAFTEHARRESVLKTGAPEAGSVQELEYLLAGLLPR